VVQADWNFHRAGRALRLTGETHTDLVTGGGATVDDTVAPDIKPFIRARDDGKVSVVAAPMRLTSRLIAQWSSL
jgi:hypothetical protein